MNDQLTKKRKRTTMNEDKEERVVKHKTSSTTTGSSNDGSVSRSKDGTLHFSDYPEFTPNLTPKEVLQAGSFGGTYFRKIYSGVTKETYRDQWKEFPSDWFEGLDISTQVRTDTFIGIMEVTIVR